MRFNLLLILLLGTTCWLGSPIVGIAPRIAAQTLEFGTRPLTFQEAARGFLILNILIDTRKFGKAVTGKAALEEIYNQLASKKVETVWLVDREAIERGRPKSDLYEAKLNLSRLPRYAPVGMVMEEIFRQTQTDGVVVIRPGFFEITDRKAFVASRLRLGFFHWTWISFGNFGDEPSDGRLEAIE